MGVDIDSPAQLENSAEYSKVNKRGRGLRLGPFNTRRVLLLLLRLAILALAAYFGYDFGTQCCSHSARCIRTQHSARMLVGFPQCYIGASQPCTGMLDVFTWPTCMAAYVYSAGSTDLVVTSS